MVTNFPSLLDTQVVILVRLVCDLRHVNHRHEDDAVGVRLLNAFLAEVVECRRHVLFDRRQQLCGRETTIAVDITFEEFCSDALLGV